MIEKYKPSFFHCFLHFYSGNENLVCEKEILIQDEIFLKSVFSLGYTGKETQSLFETKHYSYLTIDSISLKENITEFKNIKLLNLVKNFMKFNNFKIPKNATFFDVSYPEKIIN